MKKDIYILRVEDYLNEKYAIYINLKREPDKIAYEAAIKTIEMLGLTWERKEGNHIIY